MKIILGSGSPRRQEILKQFGIDFITIPSDCEEVIHGDLTNEKIVMDIARQKAQAVYKIRHDLPILTCDTLVFYQNKIYKKPQDKEDVFKILTDLSDKTHEVISGVCLWYNDKTISFSETTRVTFKPLSEAIISKYEASKEPYGKAGAYAIQGLGKNLILDVQGSRYNVIGLPIEKVMEKLKELE